MVNTEILAKMDLAAKLAAKDLDKLPKSMTLGVATWMKEHYRIAGYKRLARLLIAKAK